MRDSFCPHVSTFHVINSLLSVVKFRNVDRVVEAEMRQLLATEAICMFPVLFLLDKCSILTKKKCHKSLHTNFIPMGQIHVCVVHVYQYAVVSTKKQLSLNTINA
jgi:hypothetical protein